MTNVWVRPFDAASEFNLFVEWLHAGRDLNRYDPAQLFTRDASGKIMINPAYSILTFFNADGIVGFLPLCLAFLLDSMAFRPNLEPQVEARALQAMQTWLIHRAFQSNIPDAFFVTHDNRVLNFAVRYGWKAPDVPLLNLHVRDLAPAQEGGQ